MLGLPISFLGAMIFMPAIGVSINMISLFAFILVLGIVVDDAIIVGESVFEHRKRGKTYLQAAVDGTLEVAGPVIFAILSTVAAFVPLMYVSGNMGKFIRAIPLIVIPVLAVSLIECLYILPAHLTLGRQKRDSERKRTAFVRGRERFNDWLDRFIKGKYSKALGFCLNNRPIAIAAAIAVLLISFGIVGGGIIKFRFMPKVESDVISASLEMPAGTMVAETGRALDYVVGKGMDTIREVDAEIGDGTSVMRNVFSMVGSRLSRRHSNGVSTSGSNMAAIIMYLTPGEERDITASEITRRWRKRLGDIPGVEALTFRTNMMDFGANIDVRLSHRDTELLDEAAEALKKTISKYPGTNNIEDSFSKGKRELTLRLRPEARTLGLTEAELAKQVRGAFHGVEALRLQRGRNEVKVIIRYPGEDRKTLANLENMYIRTQTGEGVPFSVAANIEESVGPTVIRRTDRKRVINVTADVNAKVANAEEINADLKEKTLTGLMVDYPGLGVQFEGEERQRTKSMNSMKRGFKMALFAIFVMLAIPFRSYSQPLVVMAAIPFGIVGGILGHLIMGYNLSMLSMFGIVALSGVVVNDSLLLIDHINRKREEGMELHDAVIASGQRRFRPIMLTSLTTFFGLAPMMLETSMQARFLIPMAISLAFGILFATVITLLLVPTLYTSLESAKLRLGFRPDRLTGIMEER
jgi:multidrug efflux pump subunit AcrB